MNKVFLVLVQGKRICPDGGAGVSMASTAGEITKFKCQRPNIKWGMVVDFNVIPANAVAGILNEFCTALMLHCVPSVRRDDGMGDF
jgi:hypothetical protein